MFFFRITNLFFNMVTIYCCTFFLTSPFSFHQWRKFLVYFLSNDAQPVQFWYRMKNVAFLKFLWISTRTISLMVPNWTLWSKYQYQTSYVVFTYQTYPSCLLKFFDSVEFNSRHFLLTYITFTINSFHVSLNFDWRTAFTDQKFCHWLLLYAWIRTQCHRTDIKYVWIGLYKLLNTCSNILQFQLLSMLHGRRPCLSINPL